ncbi:hypothetical protein HY485_01155 [Candidatus Woesearchaeota archaeon]|nr:hypothetical protein [Candidatus Woesearchaeota archaeon]
MKSEFASYSCPHCYTFSTERTGDWCWRCNVCNKEFDENEIPEAIIQELRKPIDWHACELEIKNKSGKQQVGQGGHSPEGWRKINPTPRAANLPLFDDFLTLLELQGADYRGLLKLFWYHVASTVLNKVQVQFKKIKSDCRVHVLLVVPSGFGKKNFVSFMRALAKTLKFSIEKPSTTHPEQLVGKMLYRGTGKNKERIENKGFMSNDELVFDECSTLLHGDDDKAKESRAILCDGMNPYPDSVVMKRSVDQTKEEALTYPAYFCGLFLTQPFKHDDTELIRQGFMRRPWTGYTVFSAERDDQFSARLGDFSGSVDGFVEFLKGVKKTGENGVSVESDVKDLFSECHAALLSQGRCHSPSGSAFIEHLAHALMDDLLKFSAIQALVHGRNAVTKNDIIAAFVDLSEFLLMRLNYIEDFFPSYSLYAVLGFDDRSAAILNWLETKNALSKDASTVGVDDVTLFVLETFGKGDKTAQRLLSRLVNDGWVSRDQVGQHETRVWLLKKPEKKAQSCLGITYYYSKLAELENVYPVHPEDTEVQGGHGGQSPQKHNVQPFKILEIVKALDTGQGADEQAVIDKCGETTVKHALEIGDIFRKSAGKLGVLE